MQENRANRDWIISDLLTVIDTEDLHFCLEYRTVEVCGQEIVWNEPYNAYSRKTIINHISNIRRKLKLHSEIPDYIKSVYGVGYKFDIPHTKE